MRPKLRVIDNSESIAASEVAIESPDEVMAEEFVVEDNPVLAIAPQPIDITQLPVLEISPPEPTPIDGIEILVNLAKSGKIDPWDINICDVADEYLKMVADMTVQNLKLSGKTILLAAILLRMKSDILSGMDFVTIPQHAEDMLEDADFSEWADQSGGHYWDIKDFKAMTMEMLGGLFGRLDRVIGRRTSTKAPRVRKVTLDDLIREVRHYEELEKTRALKEAVEKVDKRRRGQNYENFSTDDCVELAHEEFIEDTVFKLKAMLETLWIKKESIDFYELSDASGLDDASAFIALMFLASRSEVTLEQEVFYGPMFVRRDDEEDIRPDNNALEMEELAS